jgi:hypothetical protein
VSVSKAEQQAAAFIQSASWQPPSFFAFAFEESFLRHEESWRISHNDQCH